LVFSEKVYRSSFLFFLYIRNHLHLTEKDPDIQYLEYSDSNDSAGTVKSTTANESDFLSSNLSASEMEAADEADETEFEDLLINEQQQVTTATNTKKVSNNILCLMYNF
jgi:hypothetical protein